MSDKNANFKAGYKIAVKEASAEIKNLRKKLQAAEENLKELQEQAVADIAIREKLLHENKILREAVELAINKAFNGYDVRAILEKALEKVGGGE